MKKEGERENWEHVDRGNEGGRREDRNDWLRESQALINYSCGVGGDETGEANGENEKKACVGLEKDRNEKI